MYYGHFVHMHFDNLGIVGTQMVLFALFFYAWFVCLNIYGKSLT